jgi:tetraacyldisaccharide 4'-kinase
MAGSRTAARAATPPATRLAGWLTAQWALPRPSLAMRLLQPLSWMYGGLAALHRALYRSGLCRVQRAPVPLLVVGNLVTGGAGKTPTVMAVVGLLRAQGWTPGVISRGHGRRDGAVRAVDRQSAATDVGDEPLLIHLRTGVPVVVGADRAAAAQALCAAHPSVDILVADDGLQHHRLHHDLALLVFDERGAGNGLLLPAGPLREPLPYRLQPHQAVLYNAGAPSTDLPGCTGRRRLAGVQPLADWWAGAPLPGDGGWAVLRTVAGSGTPLLAAAGLARPEPFFRMLEAQGQTIDRLPLADHDALDPLPWPAGASVVITEKDAVKLPPRRAGTPGLTGVWVAQLDFQPEPAFADALRRLCAPLDHCKRPPR